MTALLFFLPIFVWLAVRRRKRRGKTYADLERWYGDNISEGW